MKSFHPMLCILVKEPFNDREWIFETKWDGFRALASKNSKVILYSRNGKSFNQRFPSIIKELEKLPGKWVIDGEIVILDKKKRSRFQFLQNEKSDEGVLCYCIFDILFFEGRDLRQLPLIQRKAILKKLLGKKKWNHLRFSEHIETYGKRLFTLAKKKQWEGIIAKRKDSTYQQRRSKDWLKIKTKLRQEFVIGGFTEPCGSRKWLGSLLVGVYDKGKLHYAGHVGGGFNEKLLKQIHQKLIKLKRVKCSFIEPPLPNAPVTWVQPKLVCEVAFAEWTQEGILRQPIFQGLRLDKNPQEVIRESSKIAINFDY